MLENYVILDKLSRGGPYVVYKAIQKGSDREVVVKMMPRELNASDTAKTRYRRCVDAFAGIDHPNIVRFVDEGNEGGQYYYAMPYVGTDTLRRKLGRRRQPLSLWDAVNFTGQLAMALVELHKKGVVHEDVKPASIFVNSDKSLTLADFGLQWSLRDIEMVGVDGWGKDFPKHVAPEMVRGEAADRRTDLYQLGMVLYELLTSKWPYGPIRKGMKLEEAIEQDPVPPRKFNPDVPEALEAICLKLLAREPEDRYQTAEELLDDLGPVVEGLGAPPAEDGDEELAEEPPRRDGGRRDGRSSEAEDERPRRGRRARREEAAASGEERPRRGRRARKEEAAASGEERPRRDRPRRDEGEEEAEGDARPRRSRLIRKEEMATQGEEAPRRSRLIRKEEMATPGEEAPRRSRLIRKEEMATQGEEAPRRSRLIRKEEMAAAGEESSRREGSRRDEANERLEGEDRPRRGRRGRGRGRGRNRGRDGEIASEAVAGRSETSQPSQTQPTEKREGRRGRGRSFDDGGRQERGRGPEPRTNEELREGAEGGQVYPMPILLTLLVGFVLGLMTHYLPPQIRGANYWIESLKTVTVADEIRASWKTGLPCHTVVLAVTKDGSSIRFQKNDARDGNKAASTHTVSLGKVSELKGMRHYVLFPDGTTQEVEVTP